MSDPAKAPAPDVADFARPPVRTFTTKDGLPQNTIQAMAFDRRGYLWVGTQDGAARYNGREWLTVSMPNPTRSNFVGAIAVDEDGGIWFGTNGGGVARLRRGEWTEHSTATGELPNDQVRCLLATRDRDGRSELWVGTRDGLARFARGRWSSVGVDAGLPAPVVRSLLATRADDGEPSLWVGTSAGLARLARGRFHVYDPDDGLPAGAVTCLLETVGADGARTLWAGTEGGGLARLEGGRWSVVDATSGLPDDTVRCLLETRGPDGERSLWVGTDAGLARRRRGIWTTLGAPGALPHNVVMSLLAVASGDAASAVWLGTMGGGVARLALGRWRTIDAAAGLPSKSVWSVLERAPSGGGRELWLGTMETGVARWVRGAWETLDARSGLPDDFVLCQIEAGPPDDRAVWVGTLGGGVARVAPSGATTVYDTTSGLPHDAVLSLVETHAERGPAVWAGTNGGGLARFRAGEWTTFDTSSGLPNNVVGCLLETAAPNGARTLWAGTNGGGLARRERGAWSVVDRTSGLPNDLVMGLYEARGPAGERELWVGTHGGGVAWTDLDARKPRWRTLSSATWPAISSDVVYQIRQDRAGRIYLYTNRGIDRLTRGPATGRGEEPELDVFRFTSADGLPGECNSSAALVDSRGRVWAGTGEGAAVLDPEAEIVDREPKPLRVERAQVFGRDTDIEPGEALAHDENDLAFEYALVSYHREEATRYRTQLVGFDRKPSDWTADWKRAYTNLPEGAYTFRVWGRDYAGNVSGPVEHAFRVKPAPWRTWWAYGLYAGTAASAGYAAIRYRLEALRRRNLELEAAIDERTAQLAEKVDELQVSERRALDSERRALDASRSKSVFLSNMSHELRTPLNAILGFVQVMQRDRDHDADDRESLEIVMRSGEHLLGLINDVLSISKIEAGKVTLNEQPFDLPLLLRGIEEMIRVRATGKGLALEVDVDPGVPRAVVGDEGKLRQVLINLLGNAVKFTERGGVALRAVWRDGRAAFEVEDTGHGIADEEIGKLFQPFQQTESGEKSTEGTGLGLAISRTFVQLMGGDVAVRSVLGEGTTFAFEVALPEAAAGAVRREARRVTGLERGQPAYRVVAVDDTPANRLLLRRMLEPLGFQVREAATGVEAVELYESWRPHALFMDSRLPVMSGLEATREIRRLDAARGEREPVRIVALTASAFEHDREAFRGAGCDAFVAKPFREAEILDTLAAVVGARFTTEAPPSREAPADRTAHDVDPARFGALDDAERAELSVAVLQGDLEAAYAAIDALREREPALADDLRALVRAYRFDAIADAIAAYDASVSAGGNGSVSGGGNGSVSAGGNGSVSAGSGSDRVDPER